MKIFVSLLLLLLLTYNVDAGEQYPVSQIAPGLLKNANSVLRYEAVVFEVINTRETIEKKHYVITILNEKGDDWAEFDDYYDKHRIIESVEGTLFDASGRELKKMKRKDLHDGSGVSAGTLMDDNRVVSHNFFHRIYPYTIEYIVTIKNKSTLFFPGWVPQGGEFQSVQQSSYTLITPSDYAARYKVFNYPGEPVSSTEKNKQLKKWSVSQMPAIKRGPYSPMWHELTPYAIFGPTDFQMDDYKGNMKDWKDFGKFVHSLRNERDVLPENIKAKVKSLTSGINDTREKINILYRYMQENTRYISIQLGIGGWQPFPAKDVAAKGYGDCKALTNYMYSLLKEAGINSYYTLVRAGNGANYITEDFPSQQFNHVILSVPVANDTVWLECTSQTQLPGYLGNFTGDRPALITTEEGGILIRTPRYGSKQNLQIRNIVAELEADGTLNTKIHSSYTGLQQDRLHGMIHSLSKEKQKEILVSQFDFATYDINDFSYQQNTNQIPEISESLDITVSNYATFSGKRLFLNPNIMTRSTGQKLEKDTARKHEFKLTYAYIDIDSVKLEIPDGYTLETTLKDINISTPFGTYSSTISLNDKTLTYIRSIEHNDGKFPAKKYNELVDFYSAIYKADHGRIVFVKNDTPPKKGF